MKAEGRLFPHYVADATMTTIHFIGNAKRGYTGTLNVSFKDDRAVIIEAIIDEPHIEYTWNAELGGCSDFPGSNDRCNK
jgi:hypothetical protein